MLSYIIIISYNTNIINPYYIISNLSIFRQTLHYNIYIVINTFIIIYIKIIIQQYNILTVSHSFYIDNTIININIIHYFMFNDYIKIININVIINAINISIVINHKSKIDNINIIDNINTKNKISVMDIINSIYTIYVLYISNHIYIIVI